MRDINYILNMIPHRYPFIMIDKVVEESKKHIKTLKNVTVNEPHFSGHFPEKPIMPGVLILESGNKHFFNASEAIVVDKTGAGDFFAAGYLYGLQKGLSVTESAEIANKSAAHVISEIGVRPKKNFD